MRAANLGGCFCFGRPSGRPPRRRARERPKLRQLGEFARKLVESRVISALCVTLLAVYLPPVGTKAESMITMGELQSIQQVVGNMSSMLAAQGAAGAAMMTNSSSLSASASKIGSKLIPTKSSSANKTPAASKTSHSPAVNSRLRAQQSSESSGTDDTNRETSPISSKPAKARSGNDQNSDITTTTTTSNNTQSGASREPKMMTSDTNHSASSLTATTISTPAADATASIASTPITISSAKLMPSSRTNSMSARVAGVKSGAASFIQQRQQPYRGQLMPSEWPATSPMTTSAATTSLTSASQQVAVPATSSASQIVQTQWRPVTPSMDFLTSNPDSPTARKSNISPQFHYDPDSQQQQQSHQSAEVDQLDMTQEKPTGYSYESLANRMDPPRQEILLAEQVAARLRQRLYHAPDETGRFAGRIEQLDIDKSAGQAPQFGAASGDHNSSLPNVFRFSKKPTNGQKTPCRLATMSAEPESECLEVTQSCSSEGMEFTLRTQEPFNGRIYTNGYQDSCFFDGESATTSVLRITASARQFPRCGTQQFGDMITNIVVVQFNDQVQTRRDRKYNLTCHFSGPGEAVVTSSYLDTKIDERSHPVQIEHLPPQNIVTSNIRLRILYRGQPTNTIALGDLLTFRLERMSVARQLEKLLANTHSEIFATNVLAKDPYSGRQVQLIDGRGCPLDPINVFPELQRNPDGALESEFYAFKIPDSNYLIFQATVRTCRAPCEPVICDSPTSASHLASNLVDSRAVKGGQPANLIDRQSSSTPSWGRRRRRSADLGRENDTVGHRIGVERDGREERVRQMLRVYASRAEMNQQDLAAGAEHPPSSSLVVHGIDMDAQTEPPVCLQPASYYSLLFICGSLSLLAMSLTLLGLIVAHGAKRSKFDRR